MSPTSRYQIQNTGLRFLGYFFWIVLFVFSLLFYSERVLTADCAFQLMDIVNNESFQIYNYRFTSVFSQVLPLSGLHLGLPFKWVLIGYSVSFILIYGFIYHLIVHVFKNDYLGWVLIFFFSLLVFDSFYYPVAELKIGITFLLLFFAILLNWPQPRNPVILFLLIFLLFPVIFTHRLVFLFFLFLLVFLLLHDSGFRNKYVFLLFGFSLLLLIGHMAYFTNWYDASKQEEFIRHLNKYYPNYFSIPSNATFLKNCWRFYYFFPLLLSGVIMGYLYSYFRKSKAVKFPLLKLILVLGFCIGYLLLVHIGSPETFHRFYHETNYLPLSIIVTIPILFDFIPKFVTPKYLTEGFGIILLIRLSTIYFNHMPFEKKLDWMAAQMNVLENQNKLIIAAEKVPNKIYSMNWAMPYESLLLSKLVDAENLKTIFISESQNTYQDIPEETDIFLTVFKKHPVGEYLNGKHFPLKNGKYIILD